MIYASNLMRMKTWKLHTAIESCILCLLVGLLFVLDRQCYLYAGFSMCDYHLLPYETRLGYCRDSDIQFYFHSTGMTGYQYNWNPIYDEQDNIHRTQGDTLIRAAEIVGYAYNKEQLIIHCVGENNDDLWFTPMRTDEKYHYINCEITESEIEKEHYSWVRLDSLWSWLAPMLWCLLLFSIPIWLVVYIVMVLRDKLCYTKYLNDYAPQRYKQLLLSIKRMTVIIGATYIFHIVISLPVILRHSEHSTVLLVLYLVSMCLLCVVGIISHIAMFPLLVKCQCLKGKDNTQGELYPYWIAFVLMILLLVAYYFLCIFIASRNAIV